MKIFILFISLIILSASSIQAAQEIIIAVDQGNPPFMFEQNGEAAGIYPTLIYAVFERMGVKVTIKSYPWKRALMLGEDGEVGIGGIYQTEGRLIIFDYSAPLYTERVLVYVKQENTFSFNNISDLEGKTIGVLLGWSYGDAFDLFLQKGKVKVEAVNNDRANFQKLIIGRLDCVLALEMTGKLLISQEGYNDRIVALEKPVAVNDTYLVFAKCSHKNDLLNKFNTKLKAMKDDGTYDEVIITCLKNL